MSIISKDFKVTMNQVIDDINNATDNELQQEFNDAKGGAVGYAISGVVDEKQKTLGESSRLIQQWMDSVSDKEFLTMHEEIKSNEKH